MDVPVYMYQYMYQYMHWYIYRLIAPYAIYPVLG